MTPILDSDSTPGAAPAEDDVLVVLEDLGAARRELGEALRRERDPLDAKLLGERTAEAQLRDLEAAAQNHPYVSQVQEAVRVSWWPEQRYASGQPPRPATFTYHKRTRRGGHYVVAITRDEALALLEGGAA